MANTFTQIYLHIVFVVRGRENLITKKIQTELYKYIAGIIANKKQKLLAVNGMPDHVHLFIGLEPDMRLSDLMRDIKANSSRWINENKFVRGKFYWQEGYGAFSYSRSQKDVVIKYILNQEKHHTKKSFKEEYLDLLKKFEVEYDAKYLFDWIE